MYSKWICTSYLGHMAHSLVYMESGDVYGALKSCGIVDVSLVEWGKHSNKFAL